MRAATPARPGSSVAIVMVAPAAGTPTSSIWVYLAGACRPNRPGLQAREARVAAALAAESQRGRRRTIDLDQRIDVRHS
jgi:hypothetical protein